MGKRLAQTKGGNPRDGAGLFLPILSQMTGLRGRSLAVLSSANLPNHLIDGAAVPFWQLVICPFQERRADAASRDLLPELSREDSQH